MAFTQTQLDAVEAAIASGELTVSYEGKSVTYRSMADLMRARDVIRASLAEQGVITAGARNVLAEYTRD